MTSKLNPYVSFAGNAREAMEFYRNVFGGELTPTRSASTAIPLPPRLTRSCTATRDRRRLHPDGRRHPPGMELHPGDNVSISLSGDDGDLLRGYWEKLSSNGTVSMPLEKQMWGDEFGMCQDKFGLTWLVNIAGAPSE